jgi:transposase
VTKKRSYFTASKKSKIAIVAVEGKLTQAQITSEYGVHATQVKTWKQTALKAIDDVFSGAHEKEKKAQEQLVNELYQEIGRLQAQLSWLKKKHGSELE